MNHHDRQNQVLRLFPGAPTPAPLQGLYQEESLRPRGTPEQPFVYASFVASLDGRISLADAKTGMRKPPAAITNPRDWRLFQELAASADVVVTSGRYLRDLAVGDAQASLPVIDKPEFADLLAWRLERGLAPQPAVAIVTDTLNLPIPEALLDSGRPLYVATGDAADPSRVEALKSQGVRMIKAGSGTRIEGRKLIAALAREGFGNIDMIAGGELLNTLLADHAFDRLYLTQACRILGGREFDTLLKGLPLDPPTDFKLHSQCYDAGEDGSLAQLFSVYDRLKPTT